MAAPAGAHAAEVQQGPRGGRGRKNNGSGTDAGAEGGNYGGDDAKALEKLHGELWDAIKDGNEDEALIELGAINANAAALCAAFAGMAAEAQRAVEEQT